MTARVPANPVSYSGRQSPLSPGGWPSARSVNTIIQGIKDGILRRLFRQQFYGYAFGGLEAGQEIWAVIMAAAFTFPANLANSHGAASIASAGTATFSVQKNGVQFGTMVFSASATATFTGTQTSFAAGDVLSLIAPNPADAALEGVKWVFAAMLPE